MDHDHPHPEEAFGQPLAPPMPPPPATEPDPSVMPISFRLILLDKHLGGGGGPLAGAESGSAEQDPLLAETPEETAAIDEFLRLYEESSADEPAEEPTDEPDPAEEEPTANHYGPGPHKSGSPQSVHGRRGGKRAEPAGLKRRVRITPPEDDREPTEEDYAEYEYDEEGNLIDEGETTAPEDREPPRAKELTAAEEREFLQQAKELRAKYGVALTISDGERASILRTRNSAFRGRTTPEEELELLRQQKPAAREAIAEVHEHVSAELDRLTSEYPALAKKLKSRVRLKKDAFELYAVPAEHFTYNTDKGKAIYRGAYYNNGAGDPVDGILAVGRHKRPTAPVKQPGEHSSWTIEESTRGVFRHELGHYVWYRMLSAADRKKVQKEFKAHAPTRQRKSASKKARVSGYGDGSAEESWAEGFAYYTSTGYQPGKLPSVMEQVLQAALGTK